MALSLIGILENGPHNHILQYPIHPFSCVKTVFLLYPCHIHTICGHLSHHLAQVGFSPLVAKSQVSLKIKMGILALVEVLETQGMIFLQVLNCKMIGVLKNVTSGLLMELERLSLLLLHSSPLFPLQKRKVEFSSRSLTYPFLMFVILRHIQKESSDTLENMVSKSALPSKENLLACIYTYMKNCR